MSHSPNLVEEMLGTLGTMKVLEVFDSFDVKDDFNTFGQGLCGLIIHGDLRIDGTFEDNDHPASYVLVTGNLTAKTIITSGQLEVLGNLQATYLLGDYNDYSARVAGIAKAQVFYEENHSFEFDNKPQFEIVLDSGKITYGDAWAKLRDQCFEHGDPQELDANDELYFDLNRNAILEMLRKHKSIIRDTSAKENRPSTQRFEYGGTKFWEIESTGHSLTVRYGKPGTRGSTNTKNFTNLQDAQKSVDRLIRQKTGKGYKTV